jgi:hypothetical protein
VFVLQIRASPCCSLPPCCYINEYRIQHLSFSLLQRVGYSPRSWMSSPFITFFYILACLFIYRQNALCYAILTNPYEHAQYVYICGSNNHSLNSIILCKARGQVGHSPVKCMSLYIEGGRQKFGLVHLLSLQCISNTTSRVEKGINLTAETRGRAVPPPHRCITVQLTANST